MLTFDIQILAIALTEALGLVFFLLALMFLQMSRRISSKRKAIETQKNIVTKEDCYSFKWVLNHSMKAKKVLAANPIYFVIPFVVAIVATYVLLALFQNIGYVMSLSFVAVTIFLSSDAFEAFGYGRTITKAPIDQLSEEDKGYMEIAKEALELATVRFLMVGIILIAIGPFIRQLFDGLIYSIAVYSIVLFSATEVVFSVSPAIALFLAMVLPGILLYLPELIGRSIVHKLKRAGLIRKILRHEALTQQEPSGEERFRSVPDSISDNLIIVDSHGTMVFLDKKTRKEKN